MPSVQDRAVQKIRKGEMSESELSRLLEDAALKGWTAVIREIAKASNGKLIAPDWSRLLYLAAFRDHMEAAKLLIKLGADPNAPTILSDCGPSVVPVLIAAGADPDGRDGDRPLLNAIINRTKQDKALALIKAGADANIADEQGITALMHAAGLGRLHVFEALTKRGADPYAVDSTGRSLARHIAESIAGAGTHLSTEADRKYAVKIARQLRDTLPAQPEDPLLLILVLGDTRALDSLLAKGLDTETILPGAIGGLGMSLKEMLNRLKSLGGFFEASKAGKAIPSLKEHDARAPGATLLMWATALKQEKCIETLLRHGANPKLDIGGVSAFSMAKVRNQVKFLNLFTKYAKSKKKKSG